MPRGIGQRREAPRWLYVVSALLNLVPGFGLGYLVVERRRGFLVSLLAWVIPGAVTI